MFDGGDDFKTVLDTKAYVSRNRITTGTLREGMKSTLEQLKIVND